MHPVAADALPADALAIAAHPCRQRARAWWGTELVADSTAAVVISEPDRPPALYFPLADVRLDRCRDTGDRLVCPVKGGARLWTLAGEVTPDRSGWHEVPDGPVDGRDALWSFDDPAPGLYQLAGLAAFDHDRVRVELVEEPPAAGAAPGVVRFPNWGDAADLVDILDVRADGDGRFFAPGFVSAQADGQRSVVEGSQLLGQAVVAAARLTGGRRVVSAHLVFHRAAAADRPLEFALTEISGGRTFTTLSVQVTQDGRARAAGTLLLDATAPDLVRHGAEPPPCPGPADSEPCDMSVTGREIRMADGAYTDDPDAPVGPPVVDAWVRFREVPVDPALHAGLLAQFTGHVSIAAALRPHAGIGQRSAHRTLSAGINAIALSFHGDVRADRWLRYHHRSTFAGAGMTHSECRVYGEDGDLVASFSVDAMVRGFAAGRAADDRTAI